MNQTGHQIWTYVYPVLYTFAHVYHMRQRNNEYNGWLRRMRTCFEEGKLIEYWKSDLELEKWLVKAFE